MGGYIVRLWFLFAILFVVLIGSQWLAYAAPYAYIPNYGSNTVSVIDTATDTVTTTIVMGDDLYGADGVAVSPDGTKVYTPNYDRKTVSVIDTATNTVIATINVDYHPEGVAVSPDGTKVYVTNSGNNTVSVIDTGLNTVTATINVGDIPCAVAVSPDGAKVYIANYRSNTISVIGTTSNTVIATINVGSYPYMGIAVSPDGTMVYVANRGEHTVSVIDTATDTVTTNITVGRNPNGVAFSPDGKMAYVANNGEDTVFVIDTAMNVVTATINVGHSPCGIEVSPDGSKVYVANEGSDTISVIDVSERRVISNIKVGTWPSSFGLFIQNPVMNRLDVVAEPTMVTVGTLTNVTSNVTSNGVAINGANVTLTGNVTGFGRTNATGVAVISVNAIAAGAITMTASLAGYKNGTATLIATMPAPIPTPIPRITPSPRLTPTITAQLSNNSTMTLTEVAMKAAPPVASIVVSAGILAFWTLIEKLLLFLFNGVKVYLQGVYTTVEKRIRKISAVQRIPLLFGLSSLEILVVILSALLLGGAFAYVRDELWILQGFLVLVVVAGFTSVIHELAHWYAAHHYKKVVEYKFWGLGMITLVLTTLLRYPFSSPSRTLVNNSETLDKRTLGIISLAGPVVSIVLSILFLLLIAYGHGFDGIGMVGFNLGIMTCVYQLMPIKPMEGKKVFEWNKLVWGVVFIPSLVFYLAMLVFVL